MATERRKFQVGRSAHRKLHRGHFAFMRALIEGLDAKASWKRYLEFEGNVADDLWPLPTYQEMLHIL